MDTIIRVNGNKVLAAGSQEDIESILCSKPPEGKYQVTNIYIDPETGKVVVEYDNIPK